MNCPCQSEKTFNDCCEPLLLGKAQAQSPEQLMRSRYTAYTTANVPYLKSTLTKNSQKDFDAKASKEWAEGVEWKSLKMISSKKGGPTDQKGTVEFVATYKHDNQVIEHHEVSHFERDEAGNWKFEDGEAHTHKEGESHNHEIPVVKTVVRDTPKIGRNDPCSCGSGKKYKKCCALK